MKDRGFIRKNNKVFTQTGIDIETQLEKLVQRNQADCEEAKTIAYILKNPDTVQGTIEWKKGQKVKFHIKEEK